MPYINVNDVYIMDNTGKQVDDAVDYAIANSNRSLLDNPFFSVNQRGYTNGSASSDFVADRWFLYGAPTLTVTNSGSGLVLTGTGNARLRQHIDEKLFMSSYGQPITFSLKINDTVYSATGTIPSAYPSVQTAFINKSISTPLGNIEMVCTWQISNNKVLAYFRVYNAMTIQAAKLELGSYSTLANDVPPKLREARADCQERFLRIETPTSPTPIGYGYCYSATQARIFIPTPVQMADNPSVAITNIGNLRINANGTYITPSAFNSTAVAYPNGVVLIFTISGATSGAPALLFSANTARIDLSADL